MTCFFDQGKAKSQPGRSRQEVIHLQLNPFAESQKKLEAALQEPCTVEKKAKAPVVSCEEFPLPSRWMELTGIYPLSNSMHDGHATSTRR